MPKTREEYQKHFDKKIAKIKKKLRKWEKFSRKTMSEYFFERDRVEVNINGVKSTGTVMQYIPFIGGEDCYYVSIDTGENLISQNFPSSCLTLIESTKPECIADGFDLTNKKGRSGFNKKYKGKCKVSIADGIISIEGHVNNLSVQGIRKIIQH